MRIINKLYGSEHKVINKSQKTTTKKQVESFLVNNIWLINISIEVINEREK